MDHAALVKACIDPTLQRIRAQSPAVKQQVYEELNAGQRALMMFRVLHDHTGDDAGTFYVWVSHLLAEPPTWTAVLNGLRYFGADELVQVLEEMPALCTDGLQARADDLRADAARSATVEHLHTRFRQLLPAVWHQMGAYIRNHPDEFVTIEE